MSDIGVEFVRCIIFGAAIVADARATIVAIIATDVVFVSAATTAIGEFATGHGDEWTMAAFDDFQIADDEAMVKRNGTKGAEAIFRFLHELDSNLSDVHSY